MKHYKYIKALMPNLPFRAQQRNKNTQIQREDRDKPSAREISCLSSIHVLSRARELGRNMDDYAFHNNE